MSVETTRVQTWVIVGNARGFFLGFTKRTQAEAEAELQTSSCIELFDVWEAICLRQAAVSPSGQGSLQQATLLGTLPFHPGAVKRALVEGNIWFFPEETGVLGSINEAIDDAGTAEMKTRADAAGISLSPAHSRIVGRRKLT